MHPFAANLPSSAEPTRVLDLGVNTSECPAARTFCGPFRYADDALEMLTEHLLRRAASCNEKRVLP